MPLEKQVQELAKRAVFIGAEEFFHNVAVCFKHIERQITSYDGVFGDNLTRASKFGEYIASIK